MTQNLALDITHEDDNESEEEKLTPKTAYALAENGDKIKLDSNNTNTISDNILLSATGLTSISYSNSTNVTTKSWKIGDYVASAPAKIDTACSWPAKNNFDNCAKVGMLNVSGYQPTFQAKAGVWSYDTDTNTISSMAGGAETTFIAADTSEKTYDTHYLFGNIYQFDTATAGSTVGQESGEASSSICPKGWKLFSTVSGANGDIRALTESNDIAALLAHYGYPQPDKYAISGNSAYTMIRDDKLYQAPLYFFYSGNHDDTSYVLQDVSSSVVYIGNFVRSANSFSVFRLRWGSDALYPAALMGRNIGGFVRCLVE